MTAPSDSNHAAAMDALAWALARLLKVRWEAKVAKQQAGAHEGRAEARR